MNNVSVHSYNFYFFSNLDTQYTAQNSEQLNSSTTSNVNKQKEQDSNSNDAITDSMSINSDSSGTMIGNIEAHDFDDDWYSDGSFVEGTSNNYHFLSKAVISKSVMNPALSCMLENSGLTQDQILKVVELSKKNKKSLDVNSSYDSSKRERRRQRCLSVQNKNKQTKLFDSPLADFSKLKKRITNKSETLNNLESCYETENFVGIAEKCNDQKQNRKRGNLFNSPIVTSEIKEPSSNMQVLSTVQSSSESDEFMEVSDKFDETITMQLIDSESDDFVEVQDVPIPDLLHNKQVDNDNFQITIQADAKLQDDIFADVFTESGTFKIKDKSIKNELINDDSLDEVVIIDKNHVSPTGKRQSPQLIPEKENVFRESQKKKGLLSSCNPNDSHLEFEDDNILRPSQEANSDLETPSTSQHSLEKLTTKEQILISLAKENINKNSDLYKVENQDLIADDVSIHSEDFAEDNAQELNTVISQEENQVVKIGKQSSVIFPVDKIELELMKARHIQII